VMTWSKAVPILILSLVFDAIRLLFEMFWFFGPALAAIYCAAKVSDVVGAVVGSTLCSVGAGVVGFFAAGPIAAFGVIMAIAVGLLGWMTIGLILIMTNARLFSDHAGHSLWFIGSLLVSEVPFIGALPAITVSVARMYHAQIKSDKAALAAYEKAQTEEQNRNRQQQAAQRMQSEQAQVAQAEQQETANDEIPTEAEQEKESVEAVSDEKYESVPTRAIPRLVTVPNYTGTTTKEIPERVRKAA